MRLLLDRAATIEAADEEGRTPLWRAARSGREGVVWLLLDKGANNEANDACGRTALHIAAYECHEVIERMPILNGTFDGDCFVYRGLFS